MCVEARHARSIAQSARVTTSGAIYPKAKALLATICTHL